MKFCTKCKTEKEPTTEYFSRNKSKKDGLSNWCKECNREYDRQRWANNTEKEKAKNAYQYSKNKEDRLARNKRWLKKNKERRAEYKRAYRKKNEDKIKEYTKAYRARTYVKKKNSLREKIRQTKIKISYGVVPNDFWEILVFIYGEACLKCGSSTNLTLDHVVPLSLGGKHCITNFQILCKSCNSSKCNRSSADYRLFAYTLDDHDDRVL